MKFPSVTPPELGMKFVTSKTLNNHDPKPPLKQSQHNIYLIQTQLILSLSISRTKRKPTPAFAVKSRWVIF